MVINMKITVIGGGKVGYYIVKTMLEHGHEPTVIERDKSICKRIATELDIPVFCGDCTNLEILKHADIGSTEVVICVTGTDEANLVACQLAKKYFNVPKTIAKVNNPKNVDILQRLGVDHVIDSTNSFVSLIEREVEFSRMKQLIALNNGTAAICEIQLPEGYVLDGTPLMKLKSSALFNIVSITRGNSLIIPRGQSELRSGDKLMVIVENDSVAELAKVLHLD